MAFAPSAVYPIREGGAFIEKDHGNLFEYDLHGESLLPEYPHRVWVSENPVNDSGWRYALVKKTVAYIVVDEDERRSAGSSEVVDQGPPNLL
jgi:hypothetical protein